MNEIEFQPFGKLARLNREIVITEKLDGTNAQILIGEDGSIRAGSRNRWITPTDDNYGFARWVSQHAAEFQELGPCMLRGEWWGSGIQRGYGLAEKRFSLFNVARWTPIKSGGVVDSETGVLLKCCHVVPTLWRGPFDTEKIKETQLLLAGQGSVAAPGFRDPEGIVIYHTAAKTLFKVTLKNDDKPKSLV